MGRTILCNKCQSIFDEGIFTNRVNSNNCPVCGESLICESDSNFKESKKKELNFGKEIELGDNDSFDEEKIDIWWYSVREPMTLDDNDRGCVNTNCAKCGELVGSMPYPIAKCGDYLLIDRRWDDKCSKCGNEMKNHIISKRPSNWIDPRQREIWTRECNNTPKCPICGSDKIHKISITNKTASAITFGVLSLGHISKTWKCEICSSKF